MDARSDQNKANALPPPLQHASLKKETDLGKLDIITMKSCKGLRTWLDVYVNSMHLAACSQQLPLASERLRWKWSEAVVNELASKMSRSCSASSKTPVNPGSLSSICGSSVGFPSPVSSDPLAPLVSR